MKLYKLTDEYWETYGHTKWGPSVTHIASGIGDLCGPGWLHAYTDPHLAVIMNPLHPKFKSPILWEAEGELGKSDRGLKVGTTQLTTISIIPLSKISRVQKVAFGIYCALEVSKSSKFMEWAKNWLSGKDRSEQSANANAAAAYAAYAAANANAANAYAAAAYAAYAAADAANAADAADAAADAANAAADADANLDFPTLISKALLIK